jgi:hypothetical protein
MMFPVQWSKPNLIASNVKDDDNGFNKERR